MQSIPFFRACGKAFFSRNAFIVKSQPLKAAMFPIRQPGISLINYLVPTSKNLFTKTRNFSSSSIKSNFRDLFNGTSNKYTRLERFQQYSSPNRYNQNNIYRLTLWGLAYMAGVFFLSPYLFEWQPFSYFKTHPSHLTYTIMAINCVVFGLWQIPRFLLPLQRYALLQKDFIYSKWSLIGSTFSHQEFWHLGMNMMCLWSFGTSLVMLLGPANFTSLYLNSAMAGSLFSLWFPKIARLSLMGPSLGASGALFGLFATFSYLVPNAKMMIFFFPIPFGAWYTFLGLAGWNALGAIFRWGAFDYAAHLGGSAIGVLYGWWISKHIEKQRRARRGLSFPQFVIER
ncbi:HDL050Wp [Eremothecium sinecaudum]|uniref:HDL050Wp n=1 Tax=Eremothecium sinecaudum TaxID=45286 RepID=A0A0X8HSM2_9SACH|nr:HDL050Wp [Eremothecium sinecaudum]AMD20694.1 HDL050Wp [Eremothecium sinecaudum]